MTVKPRHVAKDHTIAVDDVRLREAARNARAWVFQCWGWLMETDLDMECPMEVDPLDIVEQIDAVLGIDPAITAIGSQSNGHTA